jgi:hypothetical protein
MNLENAVATKRSQWHTEALLFCAAHGRNGGAFKLVRWACGELMAEVPGARVNQAIPAAELLELAENNWTFCA